MYEILETEKCFENIYEIIKKIPKVSGAENLCEKSEHVQKTAKLDRSNSWITRNEKAQVEIIRANSNWRKA